MIGIKCAACGKTFEVPDDQSGKNARCPDCGAIVFVPTVASEAQAPQSADKKEEKSKHFLSPLEMVLILVILGIMIAFVVYQVVAEKPASSEPAGNAQLVRERIERENRIEVGCLANMERIAAAISKYSEELEALPPDLSALKESGHLEAGVPLFCEKSKYAYYRSEAVASKGVVEDPVLVADSGSVHRGGRHVIRTSGKTEFLKEEEFRSLLAAQQAESQKLDAQQDKTERERRKREDKARELMIAAATAKNSGKLQEADATYERLLDEYQDTEVFKNHKDDIEAERISINFTIALAAARVLVRQLRLDEAKVAYARISENVGDKYKEAVERELENVKLIENSRSLRTMGDLGGAMEQYENLGGTSADAFWKRMAHELSTEIENYRKEAAALFESAQQALKAGRNSRALSMFMSLADNYSHSAQAPEVSPLIEKLVGEVPYRERFLPKSGMIDEDMSRAITDGLAWLALNQQPDGGWKSSSAGGSALDETALTGLAMLCFLAEGITHVSGQYRGEVAGAVNKLRAAQKDDGLIGDPASPTCRLGHAFAMLALCELRNMTDDDELAPVCQKALGYAIGIQEPGTGWRLGEKKAPEDIVLTAWMQLGMLSARTGRLKFLEGLLEGALNSFNSASDADGRVNYARPTDQTRPQRMLPGYQSALVATAAAAFGRLASGENPSAPKLKGALAFVREDLPNVSRANFPYFFFGTCSLFHADELSYRQWKWPLKKVLLSLQLREGADAGAWDMGQFSDFRGGKVYPTALAILSFQAPYNYFADVNIRERLKEVEPEKGPEVTVILESGAPITGNVVSETDEQITIEIVKGTYKGQMTFSKKEVKDIIRK